MDTDALIINKIPPCNLFKLHHVLTNTPEKKYTKPDPKIIDIPMLLSLLLLFNKKSLISTL